MQKINLVNKEDLIYQVTEMYTAWITSDVADDNRERIQKTSAYRRVVALIKAN